MGEEHARFLLQFLAVSAVLGFILYLIFRPKQ